jgi:hypothetical protein
MARDDTARFEIGHPAPDRGRVSAWLLLFAFAGAALAWSLQIGANAAITGIACTGGGGERFPTTDWGSGLLVAIGVNLAALVVALAALLAAWSTLRRTHREEGAHSGGVMDAGEGRTRFIAVWGVWASVLFILAIAFNTISVFWGSLCPA